MQRCFESGPFTQVRLLSKVLASLIPSPHVGGENSLGLRQLVIYWAAVLSYTKHAEGVGSYYTVTLVLFKVHAVLLYCCIAVLLCARQCSHTKQQSKGGGTEGARGALQFWTFTRRCFADNWLFRCLLR